MLQNPVARRLQPLLDDYIENGDGDYRTDMLIDALGEIERLQDRLNALRGKPTDYCHYEHGYPPLIRTKGYD